MRLGRPHHQRMPGALGQGSQPDGRGADRDADIGHRADEQSTNERDDEMQERLITLAEQNGRRQGREHVSEDHHPRMALRRGRHTDHARGHRRVSTCSQQGEPAMKRQLSRREDWDQRKQCETSTAEQPGTRHRHSGRHRQRRRSDRSTARDTVTAVSKHKGTQPDDRGTNDTPRPEHLLIGSVRLPQEPRPDPHAMQPNPRAATSPPREQLLRVEVAAINSSVSVAQPRGTETVVVEKARTA